jgi:CDP-diacylglycerol---glycerol-3-phosphate 3-phosphatidyltransferase
MSISNETRSRFKNAFVPLALAMGRAGLTPDGLTLIGFGITMVGAVLVAMQLWVIGGIVVFVGGAFDMFDGTLARATGKASPLGAFMDSVFDRWGEAIVYLGIVAGAAFAGFAEGVVLAAAAMGAAFMVSYARAKSEGLGFTEGTGMAAVGLMPREIRLVILSIGLVLTGVLGLAPCECGMPWPAETFTSGALVLAITLAVIAIGATITTLQRILHVRSQARQQASTTNPTETNT